MEEVLLCRLIIHGRMPGLNEYISAERSNRFQAAKMKRDWQSLVCREIRHQLHSVKFTDPIVLSYTFYEPNRRRDHDNVAGFAHKVVQDAMVQMGMIRNDGWDYIDAFYDFFEVDKTHPHIVVEMLRRVE